MEVRVATERDLEDLNDLYNYYVRTSPATFDLEPVALEDRRRWFLHYGERGRHRLFVAVDGGVVGYACSSRYRKKAAYEPSVEVSVYVAPDRTGRGVGSALYSALFEALRTEDVHRAYAAITIPNDASVALHRKFGFVEVGYFREQGRKFDRWWDVAWFEKAMD